MKNLIVASLLITFFSIKSNAQNKVQLNTQNSTIYWMGSSLLGFNNHHGTVKFSEGYLLLAEEKISGGSFTIDMTTIANVDGGYNKGLVDHLKDPDFFDVFLFPTAKLMINQVIYESKQHVLIKADLSIKNVTKPIEFKAQLDYEKKELLTEFSIDRTQWNIVYASNLVTNVKDKMLSNEIKFKVQLIFQ